MVADGLINANAASDFSPAEDVGKQRGISLVPFPDSCSLLLSF